MNTSKPTTSIEINFVLKIYLHLWNGGLIILGVKKKLSILLFQEYPEGKDCWWNAQCLEYDVTAQAKTIKNAYCELLRTLLSEISVYREKNRNFFNEVPSAPEYYWELFNTGIKINGVSGSIEGWQ